MFKSIRIKNFKSFKNEVSISFESSSNIHGLWGGNDNGKSNLVDAFYFAFRIFQEGIRTIPKDLYYIFDIDDRDSNSLFEFEFGLEERMYRYGFVVNFNKNEIVEEYLFRIDRKKETRLFLRGQDNIQIGDVFNIYLSKEEKERLNIYLYDLRNDRKTLFVTHMKDKQFYHGQLSFFNDIHYFFNRMFVYKLSSQIYEYDGIDHFNSAELVGILKHYDDNIEDIVSEEITLDELRISLGRHKYDGLIDLWRQKSMVKDEKIYFIKFYDSFLKLMGSTFDDLRVYTFEIKYQGFQKRIGYEYLSTGLKQLIHMLIHMTMPNRNALFVFDDLFLNNNQANSKALLLNLLDMIKKKKSKVIFTTHDLTVLDQKILSQHEISFVHKNHGISHVKTLSEYGLRHDKVISKAYLEGIFDQ